MTWDAVAALCVVAGAVALLIWQMQREQRVCAKCEIVDAQKRVRKTGVTQRSVEALRIGQAKKS